MPAPSSVLIVTHYYIEILIAIISYVANYSHWQGLHVAWVSSSMLIYHAIHYIPESESISIPCFFSYFLYIVEIDPYTI